MLTVVACVLSLRSQGPTIVVIDGQATAVQRYLGSPSTGQALHEAVPTNPNFPPEARAMHPFYRYEDRIKRWPKPLLKAKSWLIDK